jgi:DNA-directed RNA polymerase specialized sigma24 family protein
LNTTEDLIIETQDTELMHALRRRDREGFELLYSKYAGVIYGLIKGVMKEEHIAARLMEDVFADLWRQPGALESAQDLFRKILSIVRSRSLAYIKAAGEAAERTVVKTAEREDASLTEALNAVLLGGLNLNEVEGSMSVPDNVIKTRSRNALQFMKNNI